MSEGTLPPQTLADLQAAVEAEGLAEFWPHLVPYCRPSIRVLPQAAPADTGPPLPVGASRLGGAPDLPADTVWPTWEGRPLSFLAQLNLTELVKFPAAAELPAAGLLSFFYDAQEQPWGYDPADWGRWVVLYHEADAPLVPRPLPAGLSPDEYTAFSVAPLRYTAQITLPNPSEEPFSDLESELNQLSEPQQEALWELLHGDDDGTSRLLGNPDLIQGAVYAECALVSRGINNGSAQATQQTRQALGVSEAEVAALRRGAAAEWALLLQLDSHEAEAGMMWGDSGRLYFCIPREALARRDFSAVWLVLQCF